MASCPGKAHIDRDPRMGRLETVFGTILSRNRTQIVMRAVLGGKKWQ